MRERRSLRNHHGISLGGKEAKVCVRQEKKIDRQPNPLSCRSDLVRPYASCGPALENRALRPACPANEPTSASGSIASEMKQVHPSTQTNLGRYRRPSLALGGHCRMLKPGSWNCQTHHPRRWTRRPPASTCPQPVDSCQGSVPGSLLGSKICQVERGAEIDRSNGSHAFANPRNPLPGTPPRWKHRVNQHQRFDAISDHGTTNYRVLRVSQSEKTRTSLTIPRERTQGVATTRRSDSERHAG